MSAPEASTPPELPMAFTFGEFTRGAGIAWAGFQVLFPLVYGVVAAVAGVASSGPSGAGMLPVAFFYVFLFAIPWSLGALLLVGGPAAWLLGLAMRRVVRLRWHLIAFALLGLAVGTVTSLAAASSMFQGDQGWWFAMMAAPCTAVAVAFGWWRTASWSLRDDAEYRRSLGMPPAATHP